MSSPRIERVLVAAADAARAESLVAEVSAAIGPFVAEVVASPPAGAPPNDEAFDLAIVDYDGQDPASAAVLESVRRTTRTVALTTRCGRSEIARFFAPPWVTNVLAREPVDGDRQRDLAVTLTKLATGDVFGLGKYFARPLRSESTFLDDSEQRAASLDLVERHAISAGLAPRLVRQLTSAADEMLTNALYNAPIEADGTHRFRHLPRTRPVKLPPNEAIEIQVCSDEERVGICVADPFGSLSCPRVVEYLAKCLRRGADQVDDKPGGAGLGLYYVFDAVSHLVVNLAPERRTELIGILPLDRSFGEFARRGKSFNVFVESGDARCAAVDRVDMGGA